MTRGIFAIIFRLFFLICSLSIRRATSNDGETSVCTVCGDKSSIPSNFANVSIVIPGFEYVRNCGMLQGTLSTLDSDNPICTGIQPFGTICGCPIPENACTLCPDGSSVPEQYYPTSLESYKNPLFPPGITPNCQLLQASLHYTTNDNATCSEGRQFATSCGCGRTEDFNAPTSSPKQSTPTNPSKITNSSERCTLCRDGGEFAYPEKNVTPFLVRNWDLLAEGLQNFPNPNSLGTVTCQILADLLDSAFPLNKNTDECFQLEVALGGICGCQRLERYCHFCPNDENIPQPDKLMPYVTKYRDGRVPVLTCSEVKLSLTQLEDIDDGQCFLLDQMQHVCGCNGGERYYMGTNSILQKAFLAWIPRVTGLLSLMGSMWIIIDVMRNNGYRSSMYSQIMLGISTFDCFSSVAWIFSSAPIPKYDFGEPTGVYGAIGSQGTCKAQGFFVELGLIGSVSFNVVLSIYYVLVIVKSYREFHFQRLRRWFLVVPVILACTYAFAGLPEYRYLVLSCHIPPHPMRPNQSLVLGYALIPLGVAWCVCSFNMGWIYWSVRKQSIAARKWRFPTRTNAATTERNDTLSNSRERNDSENGDAPNISNVCLNCSVCKPRWLGRSNVEANGINASTHRNDRISIGTGKNTQSNSSAPMHRAVAWQASFYLCSFLLTWPFYFVSFLKMTNESYVFWVMVVITTPLQGFFNWIVYMRSRWGEKIKQWKRQRQRRCPGKGQNDVRPTPPSSNKKSSISSSRDAHIEDEKVDKTFCEKIESVDPTSNDDDDDEAVSVANGVELANQNGVTKQFESSLSDVDGGKNISFGDELTNHVDDEEAVNHVANGTIPRQ